MTKASIKPKSEFQRLADKAVQGGFPELGTTGRRSMRYFAKKCNFSF